MTLGEIKAAISNLDQNEQKHLVLDVIKEIFPSVCTDEECLNQIRHFVDEETVRNYREQHMDSI